MPSSPPPARVFLLSPAHLGGKRAEILLRPEASFDLARRLREEGVTIGEAFSFLSGLYFRGKLAYATRFARPPAQSADGSTPGPLVITQNRGLLPAATIVRVADLEELGTVDISPEDPRYRVPLERDAARAARDGAEVVLLGSVATGKYVDVLLDVVGERLLFPTDFVGRGDMSRGAMLLRAAREGIELPYVPVAGSVRRGARPGKREPIDGRDSNAAPALPAERRRTAPSRARAGPDSD